METIELQQIILKLDQKTVDYLVDEVRRKRFSGATTSFTDAFLIRLTDALNKGAGEHVFKVKDKYDRHR
jgi:hypothetical protein